MFKVIPFVKSLHVNSNNCSVSVRSTTLCTSGHSIAIVISLHSYIPGHVRIRLQYSPPTGESDNFFFLIIF